MVYKLVLLLALFGVVSSKLRHKHVCDPVPPQMFPSRCSNYENTVELDKRQTELEQQLESANSDITALKILLTNLSSALNDLESRKAQGEMEFQQSKAELEKHQEDIATLKKEVHKLVRHKEFVGGNFSVIEKKLDTTEKELREKKAKLEDLETETEAAFNDTQRLLSQYRSELSNFNTAARELEVKVEDKLNVTKTELETKLDKIQRDNNDFSAKLNTQKAHVEKFMKETNSKFKNVDGRLKEQKMEVEQQRDDIGQLKNNTAELTNRLDVDNAEQKKLKQETKRIAAQANTKVAFSARITASADVFTGPATTHNTLIFNKLFTNVGNAYNCSTGIFTAPVKGVYHFTFMTFGYNSYTSGAILVKNGHYQVSTWEFKGTDISDTTSNTVILEMEVNDTVKIILWKGGKVHTSVFSGFLVFPSV